MDPELRDRREALCKRIGARHEVHVRMYPKGYFGTRGKPYPLAKSFVKAFKEGAPPVLVFGDSVHLRVSNNDENRRTLQEMIGDGLAPRRAHCVAFQAYTARVFRSFIGLAGRFPGNVECVVLPFNMRCLSPQWDGNPIWQFEQERAVVENMIVGSRKPAPIQPTFLDLDVYDSLPVTAPLSDLDRTGQFRNVILSRPATERETRERRRQILIYHYGVESRVRHRQFGALRDAIAEAEALGARVLVYATPLNVDLMKDLAGEALLAQVRRNVSLLGEALGDAVGHGRVEFRDWTEIFDWDKFFHRHELTEHLEQSGRIELARRVTEAVSAL